MRFGRHRFRRTGEILLVVLLLVSGRYEVYGKELHLFSAVSGIVTDHGRPVAGAEIERWYRWHWRNRSAFDRTRTDSAGHFRFPEIAVLSFLAGVIPHQPLVEQTITIRHGGREYLAWEHARNSYQPTDELGGLALDFNCDLGHDLANPAGTAMREDTWLHWP
jgi:hypothetical protein